MSHALDSATPPSPAAGGEASRAAAERLPDLVADALTLPPSERAAFLTQACGGDHALLAEALSLAEHDQGTFLERPAYALESGELATPGGGELPPGASLGECRVIALLGEGGMGEVYLADDTRLERRVAVKLLKRRLDDASLARRFRHEQKVLAALTHPNIARLYGGGTTPEGRPYLVMEYVEGEPLDRFCDRRGLGVGARLALFRKVCAAVTYAHQNLVVHRDLKPANIRVTPEGEPKLLDFGIAKLLDPEDGTGTHADPTMTLLGAMTPEYASPEQLRGEAITTASDVYSLGVVLYELLCGERPYALKNRRPDELARAICEQDPPRLSTVAGRAVAPATSSPLADPPSAREPAARLRRLLEGDLDNVVAKALRKEPGRRYASAAMLSDDIRRHCDGLPVGARRDTLAYRAGKFVRRNKAGVVAAALVALALVGGLAATTWQARVARQERDRARLAQRQAEQLNHFLQSLFSSVNPEAGTGRNLKVVEVLDRAGQNIDRDLGADRASLARAHLTLGQAYTGLKEADPAIRHLQTAVDLDRRLYGDGSLTTARAEQALGVAIAGLQRQYSQAEPWLRAALAVIRRQPPVDQGDLPELFKYLGLCLGASKQFGEAATVAEESLALARKTDGEQSEPFAKGLSQLGYLEMHTGDFARAEMHFRPAAAIYRRLSPGTPTFASTLTNLAFALVAEGKLDEPEALLQEAMACYRATVGENSASYHLSLGVHGLLHFARGDYPTAEADLRRGLAFLRPLVPRSDRDVAGGMVALGLTLTREGNAVEGEAWLRECLELAKTYQITGTAAPDRVELALAECLLAQGRYAEAEPLLLAGYARRADPADATIKLPAARVLLHTLYVAWGKPEQAARYAPGP